MMANRKPRQESRGKVVRVDESAYNLLCAAAAHRGSTLREVATAAIIGKDDLKVATTADAALYGCVIRLKEAINRGDPNRAGATAAEIVLSGILRPTETQLDNAEDWAKLAIAAAITAKYEATIVQTHG